MAEALEQMILPALYDRPEVASAVERERELPAPRRRGPRAARSPPPRAPGRRGAVASPPPRPAASPPPPADGWGTPSSHAGGWGRASPDAGAWGALSRSPDARGRSPDRRVAWSPTASSFQSPQSDSDAEDARRAEFYGALRYRLEADASTGQR
ncbi:C2 domain-containing protein [Aureococcus anophagefferens]|nr:C2 domain-containing protein [Aureococcus anophagefferens]